MRNICTIAAIHVWATVAFGVNVVNVRLPDGGSAITLNRGDSFTVQLEVEVDRAVLTAETRIRVDAEGDPGSGVLGVLDITGPATIAGEVPAYLSAPDGPWNDDAAALNGFALAIVPGDIDPSYNSEGSRIGAMGESDFIGPGTSWPSPQPLALLDMKIDEGAPGGVYLISAEDVYFTDDTVATFSGGSGAVLQVTIETQTEVVGRHIFYNNSYYDGNDAAINAADDNAIATDKSAYLPGSGQATFVNYISYDKGINGIMVDIYGMAGTPTADDFMFMVGNDNTPATWGVGPTPLDVQVRPGAGVGGSDRVTVVFDDNSMPPTASPAIINNVSNANWLEVTVKATANTGLPAPDVHYWGLAVGEIGNDTTTYVGATDEIQARLNPRNFFVGWSVITDQWDFNRDRSVNSTDEIIARLNPANYFAGYLLLIDLP